MIPLKTNVPVHRAAVVVRALLVINTALFLVTWLLPGRARFAVLAEWALIPRRYNDPVWGFAVGLDPMDRWPLLTNVFLHGGWLHLILNMWTLWLFGRSVEERMGPLRFALFYLLCGVLASWAHMAVYAGSEVPTLGASGAIAAVMGAHITLFPQSRVLLLIPIVFIPLVLPVSTWLYAAVWFALQIWQGAGDLFAADSAGLTGGIAWWAHIGGFAAGLGLVRLIAPPLPQERFRQPPG